MRFSYAMLVNRALEGSNVITRRSLAGLAAGAAAMTLAGCNTPARRFRERLTLVVDTPEGRVSGSSVTEHETVFHDGWVWGLAGHTRGFSTRGEATIVDLGARGLLFALLVRDNERKNSSQPGGYEHPFFAKMEGQALGVEDEELARFIDTLNRMRPKGDIPIENLGLLVRFRDPNDPKTVEWVDPSNLAASFGVGVTLTRATMEIVDEPLTTGIEARLPWLQRFMSLGASLDGDTSIVRRLQAPLANELRTDYFKTGI
jgi:hypothetical protein